MATTGNPMADNAEFEILLAAARSGDGKAMEQLVGRYEREVRIVARLRLGHALRPHLDSMDLVQSVHRSLLMGLRDDRFDISSPEKLVALALTIVRRKAARHWRKLQRQQRLSGRSDPHASTVDALMALQSAETDPAREVELRDRVAMLIGELEPLERELVELRMEGLSTVEAARELKLDPDVLRVRLSRLRRRLRERGLDSDWI